MEATAKHGESFEIAAVESTIENEINQGCTQKQIAQTYALALKSSWPTDWKRVNAAIMARWPKGLKLIKELAWSGKCFPASTPGPWKIYHGGLEGDDGFSVGSNNVNAKVVKVVAECWPCSIESNAHREELAANARLIAAAPELLAALQLALDFMPSAEVNNWPPGHALKRKAIEAARAALALAKGTP